MAKKITTAGLLVALAMILSYIEILFPFQVGIPGIKPGLANLVVLTALFYLSPAEVFCISLLRILLTGLLTGSGIALAFSLAGGVCSFLVMLACYKSGLLSPVGISLAGGTAHNIAQLATAACLLQTSALLLYLPFLLLAGIVTGICNGLIATKILKSKAALILMSIH